jgi:hypothetical protein
MDDSTKLFRHIINEVKKHEKYHKENSNSINLDDFTAVPKECLANVNLLKSSLPVLYSSWLDKFDLKHPIKNVSFCCNLLMAITERGHKCPYTSTFAIGKHTAHHPLQSFCRILANTTLHKVHDEVIELISRMIQILTEASTATLDVAVSDIVTILMNELEARRNHTTTETIRIIECFHGLNLSSSSS